jgi:hypothetical protein
MKINVTQPCTTCNGQKVQMHKSWENYYSQELVFTPREFFLDLGYLPNERLPPFLIPCRACRGNGEVEAWTTVEVLFPKFRELYRQFRKGKAA